jgi:hypothetical protein
MMAKHSTDSHHWLVTPDTLVMGVFNGKVHQRMPTRGGCTWQHV